MTPLQKPVPDWLQRLRTRAWRKRWDEISRAQAQWMGEMLGRAEKMKPKQ